MELHDVEGRYLLLQHPNVKACMTWKRYLIIAAGRCLEKASIVISNKMSLNLLSESFDQYAPSVDRPFPYGTAGFRSVAKNLGHVMHRSGILAVLRSYVADHQFVGMCITASHNPPEDNGVKLIDPSGGMLSYEFEVYASEFINTKQPLNYFTDLCRKLKIDLVAPNIFVKCKVILGHDTRASSPALFAIAKEAVESLGATAYFLGVVTTPQVHFAVEQSNKQKCEKALPVEKYYEYFQSKLSDFLPLCASDYPQKPKKLICDGAHGVGAMAIRGFAKLLKDSLNVELEVRNDASTAGALLNTKAGAEYVQKQLKFPENFGRSISLLYSGPTASDDSFTSCCALDGDADRLVYFTMNDKRELSLVDGDKIGVLYGKTLGKLLRDIVTKYPKPSDCPLTLSAVQTAYANGASTRYLLLLATELEGFCQKQVTFEIACVKTGVKNLHRKATDFDVSIYIESNGHGTVSFKLDKLESWAFQKDCAESVEYKRLKSFLQLFNQATGDAMTDILAAEAALHYLKITFREWVEMYDDFPSIQRIIKMPRAVLNTLKTQPVHEKYLVEPKDLQAQIDIITSRSNDARAFVRPSGTEDVCRIYVETKFLEEGRDLTNEIEKCLKTYMKLNSLN